jgi:hypothetical protein
VNSGASTKVVVDRIEGDLAVLVLYEDDRLKFNMPLRCMPEGVKEGDHLAMSFTENETSRESEKARVDDLLKQLKSR